MIKIIYISADDWCGVYVNNDLVIENHSIDFGYGIKAIAKHISDNGIEVNQLVFEKYEIDQEWIEDSGNLPDRFDEIPVDVLIEMD